MDAEAAELRGAAAKESAPVERERDAQVEKVMAEARRKCEEIRSSFAPRLSAIQAQLQAVLANQQQKASAERQRIAEPMQSLNAAAELRAARGGWKRCECYYTHSDGSDGCGRWFRPEDAWPDCDQYGTLEAACDDFTGCDRHLRICLDCRINVYELEQCQICEECDCDDGHKYAPSIDREYFCEEHIELHQEICREVHMKLCGFDGEEDRMRSGHCRKPITQADPRSAEHEAQCCVATCSDCLWTCDGSREDQYGELSECTTGYCQTCMPTALKAEIKASRKRYREREGCSSTVSATRYAEYCGGYSCVGDGCAWESNRFARVRW